MNEMDFINELIEMQKLNRLKSEYECMTCEVVVPKDNIEHPVSIVQGRCEIREATLMILALEDIVSDLKKTFPEVNVLLPEIRKTRKNERSI